jgi:ABC-type lipoprotein release transport system permease subunit
MGVLRAAGAERAQVHRILAVEGLMIGVLGALLGTLAGAGLVIVYVVANAGAGFGYPTFPAWEAALSSARPAFLKGLVAILAAPLLTMLASWLPARRAVRGPVAENFAEARRGW